MNEQLNAGTQLVHETPLDIKGRVDIGIEGDRNIGVAEDTAEGLGVKSGTDTIGGKGVTHGMEIDRS